MSKKFNFKKHKAENNNSPKSIAGELKNVNVKDDASQTIIINTGDKKTDEASALLNRMAAIIDVYEKAAKGLAYYRTLGIPQEKIHPTLPVFMAMATESGTTNNHFIKLIEHYQSISEEQRTIIEELLDKVKLLTEQIAELQPRQ